MLPSCAAAFPYRADRSLVQPPSCCRSDHRGQDVSLFRTARESQDDPQAPPSDSSCSSVRQTRLLPHRDTEDAINGKSTCSSDYEKSRNREYQQVIFISLALLSAGPVHEKADATMHGHNGDQHVHPN